MRKTILLYSLSLAVLIFLLKTLEYQFWIKDLSLEVYLGLVAILFAALGVWAGFRLTIRKTVIVTLPPLAIPSDFQLDVVQLEKLGISKREYEVLKLMAQGLSNKEIADRLFVSLNTVKTHLSNLFIKLDAKRRTQALQRAKKLNLIP